MSRAGPPAGVPAGARAAATGGVAGVWRAPGAMSVLLRERRRAPLRVGDHHRDHPIGLGSAVERVDAVSASGANTRDEMLDLGAVLLSAQVETNRLRQLGGVPHVPSMLVAVWHRRGVAQVDLDLLAVGEDASSRAPGRDPGGHLAIRLVGPVDRDARGLAASEVERAVYLVVDLAGEDRAENGAPDADRLAEVPVEEVEGVRGVVVERAATLLLATAPRAALRLEYHRPVRLAEDMGDLSNRARVEQALDLDERTYKPVVVPDLCHDSPLAGERAQLIRVRHAERERLLAEHVESALERRSDHAGVSARWGRDQNRIELQLPQHRFVIAVSGDAGVLPQYAQHVA